MNGPLYLDFVLRRVQWAPDEHEIEILQEVERC